MYPIGYTRSTTSGKEAKAGAWKYPRWIEFVDGLPKTATGKIQRYKLREG
jgi:4-hydroxybenzoate-CoA ligase